jgi:hypothetical protein
MDLLIITSHSLAMLFEHRILVRDQVQVRAFKGGFSR